MLMRGITWLNAMQVSHFLLCPALPLFYHCSQLKVMQADIFIPPPHLTPTPSLHAELPFAVVTTFGSRLLNWFCCIGSGPKLSESVE